MKTILLTIDPNKPELFLIREAAAVLKRGGIVAFPTETVYGLGANALSVKAVRKIFKAKGRPSDNPLIVHIAAKKDIFKYADSVPRAARRLVAKFWPGPLTIILKKKPIIPKETSAGLETVALRMPGNTIALALIRETGFPLAAPSANLSTKPSPTNAHHVLEDLKGKIDCLIDSGPTRIGLESTVVDMSGGRPTILRPGKISFEKLRKILPNIAAAPSAEPDKKLITKSPGMKYRHYAPQTPLIVVEGGKKELQHRIQILIGNCRLRKQRVVVLTLHRKKTYGGAEERFLGSKPSTVAKNLFRELRTIDEKNFDIIIAEGLTEVGMGRAVMNRLRKAAGENIIPASPVFPD
jgi:L-threonylcarbamoyladenylate synthase